MLKIISGGQTGADRGALDAALGLGAPCGGWCPKGRKSEAGPIPPEYLLRETPSDDYAERTRWNVRDSDGTVIFTYGLPKGGSALTAEIALELGRPCLLIDLGRARAEDAAARLRRWVHTQGILTLNVAGSRESRSPGIAEAVRVIVILAFGSSR